MKKVLLCFSIILFVNSVFAQEAIPLFDDMPVFQEKAVKPADINKNQTVLPSTTVSKTVEQADLVKKSTSSGRRPRLGRDAEPLTSLVLAPFPNLTIDLNDETSRVQAKSKDKKFEEKSAAQEEILKRQNPLTMTEKGESYDEYLQRLIEERSSGQVTKDGKIVNALGQRHNVSGFLLSDIGFGMTPEEVEDILTDMGYKLTKIEKSIPLFRTSFYNNECRSKDKLAVLADVRKCILSYAQDDDMHYIRSEIFVRAATRETIQVDYTSPSTDNISFRIAYVNKGDSSLNSSRQNMAKKLTRKNDFWNLIFDTYGLPDENDKLLWGNQDTAYMQVAMYGSAYNAYITMEDKTLQDEDYQTAVTDMKELPRKTTFTFAGEMNDEE